MNKINNTIVMTRQAYSILYYHLSHICIFIHGSQRLHDKAKQLVSPAHHI